MFLTVNQYTKETKMSIYDLRSEGFRVKISHYRKFKTGVLDPVLGYDNTLTRGQYVQAYNEGKIVSEECGYVGLNTYSDIEYKDSVSPVGGFTLVILEKDGDKIQAKHNFNNKPFCKKLGVQIALGKAVKKFNES